MSACVHRVPIETRCELCWQSYIAGLKSAARHLAELGSVPAPVDASATKFTKNER